MIHFRNIFYAGILLIVFLTGFLLGKGWSFDPAGVFLSDVRGDAAGEVYEVKEGGDGLQNGVVSVMIDFGDGAVEVFEKVEFREGETLFDITKRIAEEKNLAFRFDPPGEWGVFVRQIGERKNGEGGRFWQYWVDNVQVQLAADRYVLENGDVIEWQFVGSKF